MSAKHPGPAGHREDGVPERRDTGEEGRGADVAGRSRVKWGAGVGLEGDVYTHTHTHTL